PVGRDQEQPACPIPSPSGCTSLTAWLSPRPLCQEKHNHKRYFGWLYHAQFVPTTEAHAVSHAFPGTAFPLLELKKKVQRVCRIFASVSKPRRTPTVNKHEASAPSPS